MTIKLQKREADILNAFLGSLDYEQTRKLFDATLATIKMFPEFHPKLNNVSCFEMKMVFDKIYEATKTGD